MKKKETVINNLDKKELREYCKSLENLVEQLKKSNENYVKENGTLIDRLNECEEMGLRAQEDVLRYSRKAEDLQNDINIMETKKYNLEIENYELSEQVKILRGALKILAKE